MVSWLFFPGLEKELALIGEEFSSFSLFLDFFCGDLRGDPLVLVLLFLVSFES